VHLSIYDLRGRMVTTLSSGYRAAGTYQVSWSGRNHRGERMPSGLYLARLQVGDQHLTRKILLAK
jgi:flagellar hook assembly protein FlgD